MPLFTWKLSDWFFSKCSLWFVFCPTLYCFHNLSSNCLTPSHQTRHWWRAGMQRTFTFLDLGFGFLFTQTSQHVEMFLQYNSLQQISLFNSCSHFIILLIIINLPYSLFFKPCLYFCRILHKAFKIEKTGSFAEIMPLKSRIFLTLQLTFPTLLKLVKSPSLQHY